MSSTGWPIKYVRVHPERRRQFEAICKALGLREYEVVDQVLARWIRENEAQARLSSFLPLHHEVTIHADRVNIVATKANVLVVKRELAKSLNRIEELQASLLTLPRVGSEFEHRDVLRTIAGYRERLTRQLQKATKLPVDARDPELQELVARAESHL